MVSSWAVFVFVVFPSSSAEHGFESDNLVLPVGDGCSSGFGANENSCALGLLQRNARRTRSAPSPTPPATPESPWPEFEVGGIWDFHVSKTPVKIVGWTGMGMVMNQGALETYYPQCTYSDLPHSEKDRSVWHGHKTSLGEFVITDPDTDISDADVVVFYLPYFMRTKVLPSKKYPGQLWIATCGEALQRPETDMDCSLALDKAFMKQFDGFASYHGTADFLDPHVQLFPTYQDPPDAGMLKYTPPGWTNFGAMGDDLVTMAVSDCDSSERNTWLQKIVGQFDRRGRSSSLVSYGRCFHNRDELGKECKQNIEKWYDPWSNRCSSRSLKLVAENRVEPWYVSEKVWDALWEGSVPIYFGPPEVKYLVPPGSILYYDDFESPEALVDYILDFDAAKLAAARSWRNLPESEWGNFTHTRKYGHQTLLPRFCIAGAKAKTASAVGSKTSDDDSQKELNQAEIDVAEEDGTSKKATLASHTQTHIMSGRSTKGSTERTANEHVDTNMDATIKKAINMSFEAGFKAGFEAGSEGADKKQD